MKLTAPATVRLCSRSAAEPTGAGIRPDIEVQDVQAPARRQPQPLRFWPTVKLARPAVVLSEASPIDDGARHEHVRIAPAGR